MNSQARAIALTALAPITWGTTYIVTTELLPPDRPLLTALLRALPAGLMLLLIGRTLPTGRWWLRAATLGMLNIGVFFALLFVAAYRLPGGVGAVVGAAGPLIVVGLSALLLNQKVRLRPVLLGIAGVSGVAMVVLTASAKLDALGVAAGLAGTVAMSTGTVLAKRWGPPPGVKVSAFAGWQLIAGGLFLLPLAFLVEGGLPSFTGANLAGYAYLAVINTGLAYWLWFRGVARLSPVPLTFLGLLSPLTATVAGWAILGQALTPLQTLGMLVAFGSMVLGQFKAKAIPVVIPPTVTLEHRAVSASRS
ncbi:EamA family transporter [Phytomonospora endophytica]|uniref:Putative blue pigment (Indigoidine) exporter n=1 Tax=Phytomonospora endophytica TaxID=714109 RepID=A0A841G157_9ACTN|nr:EamA family transporter [Phytomonospora endophytica]MBB6039397.1 putative blue pigment (indigoidine) exporter [Phytomonospora endophytica]GIG70124.1 ABC transporter permease [Phytomonospora endophytica]